MTDITIFHNPACGTSRNTLAMIRNSGVEPMIVEYLKNPPGRAKLVELIAATGVPVRSVLRRKGTPLDELASDNSQPSMRHPSHRVRGYGAVIDYGAVELGLLGMDGRKQRIQTKAFGRVQCELPDVGG